MKNLNLNASTVTNINRNTGKTTDCIRCKVSIDGVTVDVTYDTIGKQVIVHSGYKLGRENCEALINALPAYLDSIAA